MRTIVVVAVLLSASFASAATLHVKVSRNGFTGPLTVAYAPRVEGKAPHWSATKRLTDAQESVSFADVSEGLYIVMVSGAEPLQRLSAKANVGADGATVRLAIPETTAAVRVTLAGKPLPRATIALTHEELRWRTGVAVNDEGSYAGPLWEPGRYSASVRRTRESGPHVAEVTLSGDALTIDVPDRHVTGRVLREDGKPVAGAMVSLRSESEESTLTARATSGIDGRFEFFGAREASHTLSARAPSYLHSDPVLFDLRGTAHHSSDLVLTRGEPRNVRVVDARGAAIARATVLTACDGHVKSTAATDAEGRATVAVPKKSACAIYALPEKGSLAVARFESDRKQLVLRVPDGSSSLRLTLKSEAGVAFPDVMLLMRLEGIVVSPEMARQLATRGLSLVTDDEGTVALTGIPPGIYEFWPYRSPSEGQTIFEVASDVAAPILVEVLAGENNATVRFKAR